MPQTNPITLNKTETKMIAAVRKLPQNCRAQAAQSITKFVLSYQFGLTVADDDAPHTEKPAA